MPGPLLVFLLSLSLNFPNTISRPSHWFGTWINLSPHTSQFLSNLHILSQSPHPGTLHFLWPLFLVWCGHQLISFLSASSLHVPYIPIRIYLRVVGYIQAARQACEQNIHGMKYLICYTVATFLSLRCLINNTRLIKFLPDIENYPGGKKQTLFVSFPSPPISQVGEVSVSHAP